LKRQAQLVVLTDAQDKFAKIVMADISRGD
jgi:hypothetical protein